MADVRIVCVREDLACAESLADQFEAVGLSVADNPDGHADATVVLWSDASVASLKFLRRACEAANADSVIASLTPPRTLALGAAPVIDISAWREDADTALAPLLAAIEAIIAPKQQRIAETLPDFLVLPPPEEEIFFADDADGDEPPQAAATIEPERLHVPTAHWRQLRAERLRSRRLAAAAMAMALVVLVGLQVSGAPSQGEISVAAAPAAATTTTVTALYDPVEIDEVSFVAEPRDEAPAPPARLVEPASAPAQSVRRDRTPPPYRSWERQPAAHVEASYDIPEPIPLALFDPVPSFESGLLRAEEASWQTASFTSP